MATCSRSSGLELASASSLPAHLLAALELVFLPVVESDISQLTSSTTFGALLARHGSLHAKESHPQIQTHGNPLPPQPAECFSTMPSSPVLLPSPHLTSPAAPEELCMASLTAHHVTLGPGGMPDSARQAGYSKAAHRSLAGLQGRDAVQVHPKDSSTPGARGRRFSPSPAPYMAHPSSEQDGFVGSPAMAHHHHHHQQERQGPDGSHQSSFSAAPGATPVSCPPEPSIFLPDEAQEPRLWRSPSPPGSPCPPELSDDMPQDYGSRQASPARRDRGHEDQQEDRKSQPSTARQRRHELRSEPPDEAHRSHRRADPYLQHTRGPALVDIEHSYLQHATRLLEDAGPRGVSWSEMRARCPLPRVLLRPGEPPTAWFAARPHLFELGPEGVRLRAAPAPRSRLPVPHHRQPGGWAPLAPSRGLPGAVGSSAREAVQAYELTLCRYLDDQPTPVPLTSLRHACPVPPAVLDMDGSHGTVDFLEARPSLFLVDPVARTVTTCSGWWQALGVPPPTSTPYAPHPVRGESHRTRGGSRSREHEPRRGSAGAPSTHQEHGADGGSARKRRYRSRSHSRSRGRSRSLSRRGSIRSSSSRSSRGSGRPSTPRSSISRGASASTATGAAAASEV